MSAAQPWLSVIVPAHNAAATIDRTLDSLNAQRDPDWEAIVIDDSSTDTTRAVVAQRARNDGRIKLITARAGSASGARNAGLAHAAGERLLFLDADDWITDDYLETMRRALARSAPGAAAYCAYRRVNPAGEPLQPLFDPRIERAPAAVFARQCGTAIHCVVVERAQVLQAGGFDEGLRTCEDWDLWYRIARTGVRFVGVNRPLAFYRTSPGSLTSNAAQLIRDSTTVLQRTFGDDDPRAAALRGPVPAFPELGTQAVHATYVHIWFAAVDVGQGKRAAHLLQTLRPPPGMLHHVDVIAELLIGALSVGAGCPPAALAERFHRFAEPLAELFAQIERSCEEPGFARALSYNCERRLLHLSGLPRPMVLGSLQGARVDVRRPIPPEPSPAVDLMYLLICDGEKVLGSVDLPVLAEARQPRAPALALEALGPRAYLQCADLRGRSRFAALFAGYGARRAGRHAFRTLRRQNRGRRLSGELRVAAQLALQRAIGGTPQLAAARAVSVSGAGRARVRSEQIPVLMYHRVSDSGPSALDRYRVTPAAFAAQMALLRERGFHALSSATLAAHLARDRPFAGRPIVLTFDDGYADFAEHAWPVLRANGLSAEVFIVTDLVGRASSWDAASGPPAPLMDWAAIRSLSRAGVGFGSHLATHRRADTLSSAELAAELTRSRRALEQQLGLEVRSIAAPYGFLDWRYLSLARRAGFEIGYSTKPGFTRLGARPLSLPRVEVAGDTSLEAFGRMIEAVGSR